MLIFSDVLTALGRDSSTDATLGNARRRLLGNVPKRRSEFNPSDLLSRIEGGDKIIILDSNTEDLPDNWREIDIKQEYAPLLLSQGQDDEDEEDVDPVQYEDICQEESLRNEDEDEGENNEDEETGGNRPKRVIIYTTLLLLSVFSLARKGSVDGTFKVSYFSRYVHVPVHQSVYRDTHLCPGAPVSLTLDMYVCIFRP